MFLRIQHLWSDSAYYDLFVTWVRVTKGWTVRIVVKRRLVGA